MTALAPSDVLPLELQRAMGLAVELKEHGLEKDAMGAALYASWYGSPRIDPAIHHGRIATLPADLTGIFRAAHVDGRRWEDGFTVTHVATDGRVRATRNGEERELGRCDYFAPARPATIARPGLSVWATVRRDRVVPGNPWWYTHEARWRLDRPPEGLARLYFHTEPAQLPLLLHDVTALLAASRVPWMVKCAIDPGVHARADAFVAFLPADTLALVESQVIALGRRYRDAAVSAGPPCTLPVAPGVAAAIDPGHDESFGEHRCRLVAEAVLAIDDAEDAAEAVQRRFASDGIDTARPWRRTSDERLPWES